MSNPADRPILIFGSGAPEDKDSSPSGSVYIDTSNAGNTGSDSPVGAIIMFEGTPPEGWLILNGGTFDKSIYPALFAHLGTNQLRDWRNRVPRGAGSLIALGELQEDAIRNITAGMNYWFLTPYNNVQDGNIGALTFKAWPGNITASPTPNCSAQIGFDASLVVPTTSENRVKAIGINFIIKAK